ncbi:MAG: hypothetical protein JWN95_236 [Frankiales bacterium]|nr:hypothetical protein [Frankiales bacterium]
MSSRRTPVQVSRTPNRSCVYGDHMTEPTPEDPRIDSRADLLPEEQIEGSDDPREQAKIILEDSDERTADPEGTKRASTQTPD